MSLPAPYYERDGIVLYHGDCLALLPELPSGSVDFIFTDPPYGHNNNNGDLIANREKALGRGEAGAARPIANDGEEANEIVRAAFGEWNRLLSHGGCCCCCCCGGGPDPQFARWSLWLDEAIGFKQMVVWDKGPMGMGWHYRRSYETVLVGEKPGAACRWFDETNKIENIIRPYAHGIRKIVPQANEHPCAKPIELPMHFIRLHTQQGHLVLDPFMGHAPTAIACILLNRRFIGIELSEAYCAIAARRCEEAFESQGLFRQGETP